MRVAMQMAGFIPGEKSKRPAMNYLMWMCKKIQGISDKEKAMRWLGFIQGVLWILGVFSISQMREHNRNGYV